MPFRVFVTACGVIVLSAFCYYMSGMVLVLGAVGWIRSVALLEVFAGIFFTPLFLIALPRRYLRAR